MLEMFIVLSLAAAAYLMREELIVAIAVVWDFFASAMAWIIVFIGLVCTLIIAVVVFMTFAMCGGAYWAYIRVISFFKGAQ